MSELWLDLVNLGVERYTILLILFLPIIASIVGFARHILGIKTLSIYAPIVITYSFIVLGYNPNDQVIYFWQALKYGLAIFALVFVTAVVTYRLTKSVHIHYYPKMAIVFTMISVMMLLAFALAAVLKREGFININIFSLALTVAVAERIISTYAKSNFKNTLVMSFETLMLTIANFMLICWVDFQNLLLANPWILLVVLLLNIVVGRYLGLRLSEIWRFRKILDQDDYPTTNGTTTHSS